MFSIVVVVSSKPVKALLPFVARKSKQFHNQCVLLSCLVVIFDQLQQRSTFTRTRSCNVCTKYPVLEGSMRCAFEYRMFLPRTKWHVP